MAETVVEEDVIDDTVALKVKEWIETRGGAIVWTNREIGSASPIHQYAPRVDPDGNSNENNPPGGCGGYQYRGTARTLDPAKTQVRVFHETKRYKAKLTARYWGLGLTEASESKAKRLVAEMNKRGSSILGEATYAWMYVDDGVAVLIGYERKVPYLEWVAGLEGAAAVSAGEPQ